MLSASHEMELILEVPRPLSVVRPRVGHEERHEGGQSLTLYGRLVNIPSARCSEELRWP